MPAWYRWLGDKGFSGTFNERIAAFLRSTVSAQLAEDSLETLWLKYGAQFAIPGTANEVQRAWGFSVSGVNDSWNGAISNLQILGPNLLTNPDFSLGALGWAIGDGWAVLGNTAVKILTIGSGMVQAIPNIEIGATYELKFDLILVAGAFGVRVGGGVAPNKNASGSYTDRVVAVSTASFAMNASSIGVGTVSNLSCRKLGIL